MRLPRPSPSRLRHLFGDQRGATAVEYGLIAALIVIAMIVSLKSVAGATAGMWNNTASAVERTGPR